jgi:hypothetical protein
LCDNDYVPFKGEYYLNKKWAAMITAKPKYIAIISRLITDKDGEDKGNHFDNGLDDDCRQACFLAHHQLLVYHCWLSFHPQEAALFQ